MTKRRASKADLAERRQAQALVDASYAELAKATCPICGKAFRPKHETQINCGGQCAFTAMMRRQAAKDQAAAAATEGAP